MTTEPKRTKPAARANPRPAPCSRCGKEVPAGQGIVSIGKNGYTVRHPRPRWIGSPVSGGWTAGCPTDTQPMSEPLAELLGELVRNKALHRVLWVIAAGRNRYEDMIRFCDAIAVEQAINSVLIVEPLDDEMLPAYHLTDAGRNLLIRWRREIRKHLDQADFLAVWEAVTQR